MVHILSMLLLPLMAAFGNVVLTKDANLPRPGDKLTRQQVSYPFTSENTDSSVWDFSSVSIVDGNFETEIKLIDTSMIDIFERNTHFKYRVSGDSLLYTGFENRQTFLGDSISALAMIYPIAHGQIYSKPFAFKGRYSSQRKIEEVGNSCVSADAVGRIIMPTGDTIDNVLRIKTIYESRLRISPIDSHYETSFSDSLLTQHITIKYMWYIDGCRYPIAETIEEIYVQNKKEAKVTKTAYIYTLLDQIFETKQDKHNSKKQAFKQTVEKNASQISTIQESTSDINELISSVSITASKEIAEIEYSCNTQGLEIMLLLSDSQGRIYKMKKGSNLYNETNRESIDCSDLSTGIYLLHFRIGEEERVYRFIIP